VVNTCILLGIDAYQEKSSNWEVYSTYDSIRGPRPISWRPRKLFGPTKPFLIELCLKTKSCICLKLFVWRKPLFILRISEKNSSVSIRFQISLWLSGCKNFLGPSRNGPPVHYSLTWWRSTLWYALAAFWHKFNLFKHYF